MYSDECKWEYFPATLKYWTAQGQDMDDVLKEINISASRFSLSPIFLWSGFGLLIILLEWLHIAFFLSLVTGSGPAPISM